MVQTTTVPTSSWRQTPSFLRDAGVFSFTTGLALSDYYRIPLPAHHLHVVTDPDLTEEILLRQGACFEKSRIYWRELRRLIGEAMGSVEGGLWEYLHQLQAPLFTPRAVSGYLPTVERITTDALDALQSEVEGSSAVAVLSLWAHLNLRIILAVLFGQDAGDQLPEIADRIADGEATIFWRSKYPWRPLTAWLTGANQRAERSKAFFTEYAQHMRESEAARDADGPTGLLLRAILSIPEQDDAPEFPESLLRNEIIVHLGASTETQSVAESWCTYLLWKHPDVLERVRDEVWRVAGHEPVGLRHVSELPFTVQVLRETMRLYPPSYGLMRDCVRETELAGQPVRVGQSFFCSLVGLHRSPRHWDDPHSFRPERFGPNRIDEIGRYQYLPFGAGKHVCIGQHLALPTMTLGVAQLAQRFDWEFDDTDVRAVGLSTLKPAGPFEATFTPRPRG